MISYFALIFVLIVMAIVFFLNRSSQENVEYHNENDDLIENEKDEKTDL